jgi:hypothetical protein
MDFDPSQLIKLLIPTLTGAVGKLPADTPIEVNLLLQLALAGLARFTRNRMATGPGAGSVGHELLEGLPPEHEWSPERMVEYVRTKAPG